MKIGDKVKVKPNKHVYGLFNDVIYIIADINGDFVTVNKLPHYMVLMNNFKKVSIRDIRSLKLKEINETI